LKNIWAKIEKWHFYKFYIFSTLTPTIIFFEKLSSSMFSKKFGKFSISMLKRLIWLELAELDGRKLVRRWGPFYGFLKNHILAVLSHTKNHIWLFYQSLWLFCQTNGMGPTAALASYRFWDGPHLWADPHLRYGRGLELLFTENEPAEWNVILTLFCKIFFQVNIISCLRNPHNNVEKLFHLKITRMIVIIWSVGV
jgi:hypothetical protein